MKLSALFRLGFPAAPVLQYLNHASQIYSPDHSTKGTRSHINVLSVLVSTRFQVLFHSPHGVLFTFPSRYCFTIGHWVVFRLGGWSPHIPAGFLVSGGTQDTPSCQSVAAYGALTLYGRPSHAFRLTYGAHVGVHTPGPKAGFGLFRFRSPLLAESRLISLPRPT